MNLLVERPNFLCLYQILAHTLQVDPRPLEMVNPTLLRWTAACCRSAAYDWKRTRGKCKFLRIGLNVDSCGVAYHSLLQYEIPQYVAPQKPRTFRNVIDTELAMLLVGS